MDILELQYEMLSRLSSQCDRLNLTDFQLETGESATDIEAAARALARGVSDSAELLSLFVQSTT